MKTPNPVKPRRVAHPPMEQVRRQPWSFVTAALGVAMVAGYLFRLKALRKAAKYYFIARRFV